MKRLHATSDAITIRQAAPGDSDAVAEVARASRSHFRPYLPDLHSIDGDKRFYRRRVFVECDVWVAEDDKKIVGFCAFKPGWVDHLYLLPAHVGMSLGKTLLGRAKARNDLLHLWVFQQNVRAIGFYEHCGFRKIEETDGSSNEEKLPDALYEWRRGFPECS